MLQPTTAATVSAGNMSSVTGRQSWCSRSGTLPLACSRLDRLLPSRIANQFPQARRQVQDSPCSVPGEKIFGPRPVILLRDADLRPPTSATRAEGPSSMQFLAKYAASVRRRAKEE